jgi:hypothetical protein
MVKRPQQKYETLFRELRDQAKTVNHSSPNASEMKNELKRYLMDLNSSTQNQPQQPQSQQLQQQDQLQPQPQSDFIEFGSTFQ